MTQETKERPILFSSEMVRAILDGRKTQTRRVMRPQIEADEVYDTGKSFFTPDGMTSIRGAYKGRPDCEWFRKFPYGKARDTLWVRETWKPSPGGNVFYRADPAFGLDSYEKGWKPSIYMPRWASRITLKVTGVRVERVQSIGQADAKKEGVKPLTLSDGGWVPVSGSDYVGGFRRLWDSINAKRGHSWDSNPWVWVVEFKQVQP